MPSHHEAALDRNDRQDMVLPLPVVATFGLWACVAMTAFWFAASYRWTLLFGLLIWLYLLPNFVFHYSYCQIFSGL